MDGGSLPVHDRRRQQHRDDRLWRREKERASMYKLKRIHCPCCRCKGRVQCSLPKVKDHLIHFGREPAFRVWRGPGARDASDDEWEQKFRRPCGENDGQFDEGLDMQGMVADAFIECDEPPTPQSPLEEQLEHIVMEALTIADELANDGEDDSDEGSDEEPMGDTETSNLEEEHHDDPRV